MNKRILKLLLSLLLCISLVPLSVSADAVTPQPVTSPSISAVFNAETGFLEITGVSLVADWAHLISLHQGPIPFGTVIFNTDGYDIAVSLGPFLGTMLLEPGSFEVRVEPIAGLSNFWIGDTFEWYFEHPEIITTALPNGRVGEAYTSVTLEADYDGKSTSRIWSIESGSLPPGLILSPSGVISGVPTQSGTFDFAIRFGNDAAHYIREFSIYIYPAITTPPPPPTFTVTIVNGGTGHAVTGGSNHTAGSNVTINAGTRTGFVFNGWTFSPAVTFAAGNNGLFAITTFTMPAANVIATANWTAAYLPTQPPINQPPTMPTQPGTQPPAQPGYPGYYYPDRPIERTAHHAYIVGFDDGFVRPRGTTTRAQVATIFFRLMPDQTRAQYWSQSNSFPDVDLEQWFNNAISTVSNSGAILGLPDGTFQPNRAITRAELAAIMVRFMNVAPVEGVTQFNDISGHWASAYINAAALQGWAFGYEGIGGPFRPDQSITRAETAALINRMLNRLPGSPEDLLPGMKVWFDNLNTDAWYYLYIQEATNSHYYERSADGIHESWTQLIQPERRWELLERPYSHAWSFLTVND